MSFSVVPPFLTSEYYPYFIGCDNSCQELADIVLDLFIDETELEAVGLVGSGNNGGDTLVMLTELVNQGWKARASGQKQER